MPTDRASPDPPPSEPPLPIDYAKPRTQESIDEGRLEAAGALHIVWGLLMMLGTCLITPMLAMLISDRATLPSPSPASDIGRITGDFSYLTWIVLLLLLCFGGMTIASGRLLLARRNRSFSVMVAVFNCALFPIGTALGAYTVFVLRTPSVMEEYARRAASEEIERY
jgi:hypothetical protein